MVEIIQLSDFPLDTASTLIQKFRYFRNTSVDNLWPTFQLPLGIILAERFKLGLFSKIEISRKRFLGHLDFSLWISEKIFRRFYAIFVLSPMACAFRYQVSSWLGARVLHRILIKPGRFYMCTCWTKSVLLRRSFLCVVVKKQISGMEDSNFRLPENTAPAQTTMRISRFFASTISTTTFLQLILVVVSTRVTESLLVLSSLKE